MMVRCALLCLAFGVALASAITLPEEDMEAIFTGYMTRFNKVYPREEIFTRFKLFRDNYMRILEHNNKQANQRGGVVLGTNHLTDLTVEEYRKLLGFRLKSQVAGEQLVPREEGSLDPEVPEVDWVAKGAVNPVKNQGQCGSCWAFSAVSAAESAIFLAGKGLPSLSEQQVLDCTNNEKYMCDGCMGCLMHRAFQYMIDNKGLCSEKEYEYTAATGKCQIENLKCAKTVPIVSYDNVTCSSACRFCDKPMKGNETDMLQAVADAPLSIALEADSLVFQHYQSGVLDSAACGTKLDHGVVIVGYGTENGIPYWKVRNSWGAQWGDNGYIKIARGKNVCGIALYSNQPYVD